MKLWHVTYTCFGFFCHAVVVHASRGEAIVLLALCHECRGVEAYQLGIAFSEQPYVVCDDRLDLASERVEQTTRKTYVTA